MKAMTGTPTSLTVLDTRQLQRIQSVHRAHRSDASFEHGAECSVIVANEIFRCRVHGNASVI
jgi:hypothetical protein